MRQLFNLPVGWCRHCVYYSSRHTLCYCNFLAQRPRSVSGQTLSLDPSEFLRSLENEVDLHDTSCVSVTPSETARFLETLEDLSRSNDLSLTQQSSVNLPVLPPPDAPSPPMFTWGKLDATSFTQSLEAAYNEVTHWRKNLFSVPFGNAGKKFVL